MQLRLARLCLDCEEVHDAPQQCPLCASETFAYLTRWVPPAERRSQPRPLEPVRAPSPAPGKPSPGNLRKPSAGNVGKPSPGKMIGYGVVGLGIMGLARWFALGKKHIEESALKKQIGELR